MLVFSHIPMLRLIVSKINSGRQAQRILQTVEADRTSAFPSGFAG